MMGLQDCDPEQARLMAEECILVDENDVEIGSDSKKNCHLMKNINEGKLHRAFSLFLFYQDKLLLQQRSAEKITFPSLWTNTCCSHPLFLESERDSVSGVKKAVVRKLEQELGIPAEQVPLDSLLFLTRIHYLAPSNGEWGEHESKILNLKVVDYICIFKPAHDVSLNVNANEIMSTRYVSKQELMDMMQEGKNFTPWFKLISEQFLFKWWDNLDNLNQFVDVNTIHRL